MQYWAVLINNPVIQYNAPLILFSLSHILVELAWALWEIIELHGNLNKVATKKSRR